MPPWLEQHPEHDFNTSWNPLNSTGSRIRAGAASSAMVCAANIKNIAVASEAMLRACRPIIMSPAR